MRRARRTILLIIVIPLLAMTAGSLVFLAKVYREVMSRLPETLTIAASERIAGTVTVGELEISPSGAVINDVVISDGPEGSDRPVVKIPRVKIAWSLSDIGLRRRDPVESIKGIEVLEPEIFLERSADGRWNIAGLLKPSPPGRPLKFAGKVYVKSGRLVMCDRLPNSDEPVVNALSDMEASIDFSETPMAKYSVSGKGQAGRFGRFAAEGRYNLAGHSFNADLDILNANLSYWSTYPANLGLKIPSGEARARIELSKAGTDEPLRHSAVVQIRQASVEFRQIRSPVQDVNGELGVRDGVVNMRLEGKLGSAPVLVSGQVLDLSKPRLALELTSDRVNFSEIAGLTPWARQFSKARLPKNGRAKALISGPPKSLAVDFYLEAPSLAYSGFEGSAIAARGTYANRRIRVQNASAATYGGRVEIGGEIDLSRSPRAKLNGRVLHLKLDRIPILRKQGFRATGNGSFQVLCRPGGTEVDYQGTMNDMQFNELQFDQAAIEASYVNGTFLIHELSAETFGGLVAVSGEIEPNGKLSLHAAGSDINLAQVRDMYWGLPTVGRAQFAGQITGTLGSPIFEGDVEAYRVMASGLGIERIAGNILASRKKISVDDLVIYDYPGTVSLSGTISEPLAKSPTVDLSIKVDSMDIGAVSSALGQPMLEESKMFGDVTLSGRLRHPKAEASLRVEGGSYRRIALSELATRIAYEDNNLLIEEFDLRLGDSRLTANGEISDGRISIAFESDGLNLQRFSTLFQPYAFASGDTAISGSISGTADALHGEIAVDCENPTINGQTFERFAGKASLENKVLAFSDLTLSDADSRYSIPELSYNPASGAIEFSAGIENGQAGKMLAVLDSSASIRRSDSNEDRVQPRHVLDKLPRPFAGLVNGSASGSIRLTDDGSVPDVRAELGVDDMRFGSGSIKSVRTAWSWQDGVAKLETLEALDGDTNVYAEASIGPADALNLRVDAHNLSIDTLSQWAKLPQNFSGNADVTIVASGTTTAPYPEIYIEVVDPVIGGAKFDRMRSRLTAGEMQPGSGSTDETSATGRMDITDLTLTLGDQDLRVSGYIPVDWRRLTVPRDSPMLVQSSLDDDSLGILLAFSNMVAATESPGSFEGSVELGGTVQSPRLDGNLTWRDGQIRLSRINSQLENIDASIAFAGDRLQIEEFTGSSAEGGTFDITGSIALAGLKPSLDLEVRTSGLNISGENITSIYGEEVRAQLNTGLRITQDLSSPVISGNVAIPQGSISLPSKPAASREPVISRGIDPKFDVEVFLGRDVRFDTARLKCPLYGSMTVAGPLSQPVIEGTLDISHGTILFPMRQFRILPGSTIALRPGTTGKPTVLADMRAQTRLTAASSLGKRERYTVTMVAQGPLDRLKPRFDSSPPGLSEQQIVALLTGQRQLQSILAQDSSTNIGEGLSGLFSAAMMPSVFEPIAQAFESTLGFEEFALEMGYGESLQLTIGERLWDRFYLDYSTVLGARPDYADSLYELRLSYRFKHSMAVGVQTDENRTFQVGVEGTLRF